MKKSFLCALSLAIGFSSMAQQTTVHGVKMPTVHPSNNVAVINTKKILTGAETNADGKALHLRPANPFKPNNASRATTETIIGSTTYDLQSNSGVQDRIIDHGDGTLSAVWTMDHSNTLNAPARGTGYNFFNGTSWGAFPTTRIEPERVGWPTIGKLVTGKEVVLAHNTDADRMTLSTNSGPGTSSWSSSDVTSTYQVWNRMGVGGPDGLSIHYVSIIDPELEGTGGTPFKGVRNALVYHRSLDGGNTWDIQGEVIPGLDSSNYAQMSGDSYSLQVKGNTIAVCYWGTYEPTILAKSTDNGNTWTTTKIIDVNGVKYDSGSNNTIGTSGNVVGISDITGDGIADTLQNSDGAGAILIDENDMVHVTFGNMFHLDVTPGDNAGSYFPGTNGLMYWNENMGDNEPEVIGFAFDFDGQGLNGVDIQNGTFSGAEYFTSLSGMPHMALGNDGDIYVSYSAYMEQFNQGFQSFRHIYITKSTDKGCSWTLPVDVTPLNSTAGLGECVFGSMARNVDTDIHLVYQRDFEPGLAVRGDEDDFDNNDIVHIKVPVADLDTASLFLCYSYLNTPDVTAFCPGDSVEVTTSCGSSYLWSSGETTSSVWSQNTGALSVSITTQCGTEDVHTITLTDATGSGTVDFDLSATEGKICNGDTTHLSSSNVSQGLFTWSTGETTQTIAVDTVGTYHVTVNNCAGSSSDSIVVTLPDAPIAIVTGDNMFCEGASTTLSAGIEPGANYVWSTGDSAQLTVVDTIAAVSLTVTNCAGSDSTTYSVGFFPSVSVSTQISNNDICEASGNVNVTAFGTGGSSFSYLWETGATTQIISLNLASESGTYAVTVTNECSSTADTVTAEAVNIYPLPATPTVTFTVDATGKVIFTSDAAENKWYLDGTLVKTDGSTYEKDWKELVGKELKAEAVSTDGCISSRSTGVTAVATGVYDLSDLNGIRLYPNPNEGVFTVALDENSNYQIQLRNVIGQLVHSQSFNGDQVTLDFSSVEKGIYFVDIKGDKFEVTKKVIIK